MSVCRSCGAPVRWAETVGGRKIPVEPYGYGNLRFVEDGIVAYCEPNTGTHRAHFASCPEANRWRRSRGGKRGGDDP